MYWTQKQFSVMSAEQNLKICLLLQMDPAAENTVSLPSEVPAASPEIIPEKSDTINTDTAQASDETLTDAITDSSLETKESSTVPNESLEPHKFFCPNCKNEMQEDDVFCNECGTKVK